MQNEALKPNINRFHYLVSYLVLCNFSANQRLLLQAYHPELGHKKTASDKQMQSNV